MSALTPDNPLAEPADRAVLEAFLAHFGIPRDLPPRELLRRTIAAFARLPYENLTKIIKHDACGSAESSRRAPLEVVTDHRSWGAGGTCFSLTATLVHLVRALGWRAEPLLADRRYGPDTHSALVVWLDDRPHLVDPGYLIVDPIPLDVPATQRIATSFNQLVLTPRDGGERLELSTVQNGSATYRLTFRTQPVDAGQFLRAWDASFAWDMMQYPVLTRADQSGQTYLQGRRLQHRTPSGVDRQELSDDELIDRIAAEFGIAREVARRALTVLGRSPHCPR